DHQDNGGFTALMNGSQNGHLDVVRELLAAGAAKEIKLGEGATALNLAFQHGHVELANELLATSSTKDCSGDDGPTSAKTGWTAVMTAARDGQREALHQLLAAGADKDGQTDEGWTAFMIAALNGKLDIIRELLAADASKESQSDTGLTVLMIAAHGGHLEMVHELLAAGASQDCQDNLGVTALIWAALSGQCKVVHALLAAGANKDHQQKSGNTALIWAASNGHVEVVRELLSAGASKDLKTNDGQTALQHAQGRGHHEVIKILEAPPEEEHEDDTGLEMARLEPQEGAEQGTFSALQVEVQLPHWLTSDAFCQAPQPASSGLDNGSSIIEDHGDDDIVPSPPGAEQGALSALQVEEGNGTAPRGSGAQGSAWSNLPLEGRHHCLTQPQTADDQDHQDDGAAPRPRRRSAGAEGASSHLQPVEALESAPPLESMAGMIPKENLDEDGRQGSPRGLQIAAAYGQERQTWRNGFLCCPCARLDTK
ncbi:unnamed protein product, partial [Durusdinium trenchii]